MDFRVRSAAWGGLIFLAAFGLTFAGCGSNGGSADVEPEPVAQVHVVVARQDTLAETLTAYGKVIPAPGSVQSFAVPFECVVLQVLVSPGQRVEQGGILVRVALSPEMSLAANKARDALASQQTVYDGTAQRYAMGLATKDDRAQQEQALKNAKAEVEQYQAWMRDSRLIVPASGLVREVMVTEGALVPAGSPLVSVALPHRFEVRLGIEPEDVAMLRVGQPVGLSPVDGSGRTPLQGRIRSVGQQVSPATRLVDVLVAPPEGTDGLLLNQFVRGKIIVYAERGLVVPRAALLPSEDHFTLFTVRRGRAVRHDVVVGAENDSLAQVDGGTFSAGDSVIVLGNYELNDSTLVHVVIPPNAERP